MPHTRAHSLNNPLKLRARLERVCLKVCGTGTKYTKVYTLEREVLEFHHFDWAPPWIVLCARVSYDVK